MTSPGTRISPELATALDAADLRVLLMCLYHLTGDDAWLAAPFQPRRDVSLIADPMAGFDADTAARIRSAVAAIIQSGDLSPAIDNPGVDRLIEMMSVYLGEDVAAEYGPWIAADFGFAERERMPTDPADHLDVLIIGAGISGLCLARRLAQLGIGYTIVDKNDEIGGTWWENHYPGCGVDTPNHFYSYSFRPNPAWAHYFSPQPEILDYLRASAAEFNIADRLRTSTRVTACRWDDNTQRWSVDLNTPHGHETMSAAVVVSATGHFNQPLTAPFDGIDSFSGQIFHSARWPDGVTSSDLVGKRVAVVGTGASAMQLVPTIADDVEHLTVFQRTPQWVRPVAEYNARVDPAAQWLFEHLPYYDRWYRFGQMWRYGDGLLRFLRRDPEWPHPERAMNRINDRHRVEMTEFITTQLDGRPDLLQHCLPTYPPFGKRILIDNNWFATLRRSNVTLEPTAVERIEPDGIRTIDGALHPAAVIVLATGFNVTNLAAHIDIVGRDGTRLADDWADENPTAYLGITVPKFPNLFVMYGPNTNMGHGGSGMWLAETQTDYIAERLIDMIETGLGSIEVREAERRAYSERVDELHAELVWTHPGTATYYRNRYGKVRSPMPFRLVDYWTMCRTGDLAPFDVEDCR